MPPIELRGDEESLFAAYHLTLRARVARWVNTSPANVEEACSFAWMQLVRCQPARATAMSWLTTVAVREAVRLDHQARRDAPLPNGDDLAFGSTSFTHTEALAALEVVASLPRRQRELIGLQVAGFTYDEIAALTGTTHRTVDRHLRRARAALRNA